MAELLPSQAPSTPARVSLGITGISLPTAALLDFQMAQAEARDAVHEGLATLSLRDDLNRLRADSPLPFTSTETLLLHSAAPDRATYLKHPELGRRLAACTIDPASCNLAIVLADGLSALAVNRHAVPLLRELIPRLEANWTIGPIAIVTQGRVAIADEIGQRLQADAVLMLLGERPGLSAPDSLGAYITWAPRAGRTDAERNCVSNIRSEGLIYADAATRIATCLEAAGRLQLTGVALNRLALPAG